MDEMTGRARFLGRAAVLGAATFATLLAAGAASVANAAQAAAPTAPAAHVSFTLPAGVNAVKVGAGSTQVTVTRAVGYSPQDPIPCTLSVSNPAYNGAGGVSANASIRCAYPTDEYIEIGLAYNGGNTVYNSARSSYATWVTSVSVTRSAVPGYYQANAIAVLGNGQQFGYYYSSNVYISQ